MADKIRVSWKDASRKDWGTEYEKSSDISTERIQAGAILRIADATELMAKRHTELVTERDRFKEWYESASEKNNKLLRRIRGLKSAITRLKNKSK